MGLRAPCSALVVVLTLAASPTVVAEDVAAHIAQLRREPMTLFDWGMFLLEEELQSVLRHRQDFLRVFYDPPSNRIIVDSVFVVEAEEIGTISAERTCYTRLHAIKLTLGVIDTDRIHTAPAADFRLGAKFSHHNSDAYSELPDAGKLGAALFDLIFIRVGIVTNVDNFPFDQDMQCEGRLLQQEVTYDALAE